MINFHFCGSGDQTKSVFQVFHDLDKLSGTWDERDAKNFLNDISDFEKIDEDLW